MHRLHVVSLPHTHTTKEFSSCAYTEKVRKFCAMMMARGHEVFLYAGERNEAPCTEHIPCISESYRALSLAGKHYTQGSFDSNAPHWRSFNARAIKAISDRSKRRDFICLIGGVAQRQIAEAFPTHMCVEFGIGYWGSFAAYRVYESYSHMHTSMGAQASNGNDIDPRWFDDVIPSYIDAADFPDESAFTYPADEFRNYYLFMGRMIERKGWRIAVEACERAGKRLVMAGPGREHAPEGVEHVGEVGPVERARLMTGAIALFAPTLYVEPFGTVAVEAMACGTPVLATDWGAFTETVVNGVTGYRCRMLQDFVDKMDAVKSLDRAAIRAHALARYSLPIVGARYDQYFSRLATLWDAGWYA